MVRESVDETVGGRSVIASGTVVVPKDGEEIVLKIRDLTYRLKFAPGEGADPKIEADYPGENTLGLTLTNFLNPMGTAWSSSVGSIDNRRLHLALYVIGIPSNAKPRVVSYTFSLGEVAP